jgi:hypothetical protein
LVLWSSFPEAGVIGEEFHFAINLTDCLLHGLTVDPGTVTWWRKQSQEAKQAITDNPTSLKSALHLLTQFLHCPETHVIPKNMPIWCRGTNFDPVMLEAAFSAASMDLPVASTGSGATCARFSRCVRNTRAMWSRLAMTRPTMRWMTAATRQWW